MHTGVDGRRADGASGQPRIAPVERVIDLVGRAVGGRIRHQGHKARRERCPVLDIEFGSIGARSTRRRIQTGGAKLAQHRLVSGREIAAGRQHVGIIRIVRAAQQAARFGEIFVVAGIGIARPPIITPASGFRDYCLIHLRQVVGKQLGGVRVREDPIVEHELVDAISPEQLEFRIGLQLRVDFARRVVNCRCR